MTASALSPALPLGRVSALFTAVMLAASLLMVGTADARMGGNFGSRGMRTFNTPAITTTAPRSAAPIQNTMTKPGVTAPTSRTTFGQPRGGFFSGFGGGLLGGLLFSGIFGSLFGFGFGGFGGGLFSIIQILFLVWLVSWFVRRARRPAMAGGYDPGPSRSAYDAGQSTGYGQRAAPPPTGTAGHDDIRLRDDDYATFEQRLAQVQDAYSREDHAALRRLTTPEMVSFLSEELSQNAQSGVRNEVRDVRFIAGDLSEAWREGSRDYATVAIHWSAIDVMVDRQTGAVVKGDRDRPAEAVELWTFVRERGGAWLLSAIQTAA